MPKIMGIGKTLVSIVLASAAVLGINWKANADPVNWQVAYQTDFSTDPGWTTNRPDHYYRVNDSNSPLHNTFRMVQEDNTGGYAYKLIPELKGNVPIKIEYDILLSTFSGSGNARFALSNEDMHLVPPIPPTSETIILDYGNVYTSGYLALYVYDQGPDSGGPLTPMPLQENYWYHNRVIYDPEAHTFRMTIIAPDGIHEAINNPIPGSFDTLDRLLVGDRTDNVGGVCSSYIDNVVISVPEPASLSLLALGGLGVLAKRKR